MHAPLPPTSRLALFPDGAIEGYASLFGEVDQARDMVMPGAFDKSLKTRGVRRVPMLFQHDPSEPIGVWLELDRHEVSLAHGKAETMVVNELVRGDHVQAWRVKADRVHLLLEVTALAKAVT